MNWSRWTIMGYRITVSVERSPNELAGNVTLYLLPHGERSREVWSSSYIHLVMDFVMTIIPHGNLAHSSVIN